MPPKKTPSQSASSPKRRKISSDAPTPIKAKAKPSAKPKSGKGDFPTQANNLFDFYPNLRKDAPLFRAPLLGDEKVVLKKHTSTTEEQDDSPEAPLADATSVESIVQRRSSTDGPLGPFALEDDETEEPQPQSVSTTPSLESAKGDSEQTLDKSSSSSVPEEYDESLHDAQETDTEKLRRDDSYYENADDEQNEDEEWTWQEYNAENFGTVESRDESVLCPVCGNSIIHLPEHDRSSHVNACLDLPAPAKQENQVDGKSLVDKTVVKAMALTPHVPVETSVPSIKKETTECSIKREPSSSSTRFYEEDGAEVKDEIDEHIKFEAEDSLEIAKDEIEDIDGAESLQPKASTAFDKIMVSHAEERQWANAAKIELNQRGTKYKTRVCPFYKILSPFPIAVDAFKYGTVPGIQGYYLTHFHSDHYGGLSSTWDAGPIYCSSITGSLVIQQLRVRPEYVVKLPMNTPTDINGVLVTLIDANHCPGSSLFFFEGRSRGRDLKFLHCGDFRACPQQLLHPNVRGKQIDVVYLDTTYLNPKYAFPSQEEVIEACSHVCRDLAGLQPSDNNPVADARNSTGMAKFFTQKSIETPDTTGPVSTSTHASSTPSTSTVAAVPKKPRGRLLVVVGTYSIGKERIVVGIAKSLNSKIYAAKRKRDILACLEDPDLEALVTDDPLAAQVHMTYLQEIRAETLTDYLDTFAPHFGRVVGFRGTGWTYAPPKGRLLESPSIDLVMSWRPRYSVRDMSPGRGSTSRAACYGVPYSEHSSFRELMCWCLACAPVRVVPTVNVGSSKSRERMKAWIDRWALEVRKSGPREVKDGQTEW